MNTEQRLREAFAQRASEVEPAPGALFAIRQRLRSGKLRPAFRLRPAYVLATLTFAVLLTVVLTMTARRASDGPDEGDILASSATSTPVSAFTGVDLPLDDSADDQTHSDGGTLPQEVPEPQNTPTSTKTLPADDGGDGTSISTKAPSTVTPPPTPSLPPTTTVPEEPISTDDGTKSATGPTTTLALEPQKNDADDPPAEPSCESPSTEGTSLYFNCGDDALAELRRELPDTSAQTLVNSYLSGPTEEEAAAGFSVPLHSSTRARVSQTGGWATVDFQPELSADSEALDLIIEHLNTALLALEDVNVLEYRLDGSCEAFSTLRGRRCELHFNGDDRTSTLVAYSVGTTKPVNVHRQATTSSILLGTLPPGGRLTDRRTENAEGLWAEVVMPEGTLGWVNARGLAAQPMELTQEIASQTELLARQITSAPGLDVLHLSPDGLEVSWGSMTGNAALIPTETAGTNFWHLIREELATPRPSEPLSGSLASLLWIGGLEDITTVELNTPEILGKPSERFDGLYYVTIYHPNILEQVLPAPIAPTVQNGPGTDASELEKDLPPPVEPLNPPQSYRAKISVMFDFLSTGEPVVYGVEAIWESLN